MGKLVGNIVKLSFLVSCTLHSLKKIFESGKNWMLILVVQRWHTCLVDWQQGTYATKTSLLSVNNFMLPGVTIAALKNRPQQR